MKEAGKSVVNWNSVVLMQNICAESLYSMLSPLNYKPIPFADSVVLVGISCKCSINAAFTREASALKADVALV